MPDEVARRLLKTRAHTEESVDTGAATSPVLVFCTQVLDGPPLDPVWTRRLDRTLRKACKLLLAHVFLTSPAK